MSFSNSAEGSLIAARDIPEGDLIFEEQPILSVRGSLNLESSDNVAKIFRTFALLSSSSQSRLLQLPLPAFPDSFKTHIVFSAALVAHSQFPSCTRFSLQQLQKVIALIIQHQHSFSSTADTLIISVFEHYSRLNHSCYANCFISSENPQRLTVRALSLIPNGTTLTVDHLLPLSCFLSTQLRQLALRRLPVPLASCCCERCTRLPDLCSALPCPVCWKDAWVPQSRLQRDDSLLLCKHDSLPQFLLSPRSLAMKDPRLGFIIELMDRRFSENPKSWICDQCSREFAFPDLRFVTEACLQRLSVQVYDFVTKSRVKFEPLLARSLLNSAVRVVGSRHFTVLLLQFSICRSYADALLPSESDSYFEENLHIIDQLMQWSAVRVPELIVGPLFLKSVHKILASQPLSTLYFPRLFPRIFTLTQRFRSVFEKFCPDNTLLINSSSLLLDTLHTFTTSFSNLPAECPRGFCDVCRLPTSRKCSRCHDSFLCCDVCQEIALSNWHHSICLTSSRSSH